MDSIRSVMQKVRALLAEKAIGEVRMLSADFGFRAELNPSHRLFSPEYGGGALLDVGTYLVSFSSMVLGPPSRLSRWPISVRRVLTNRQQ